MRGTSLCSLFTAALVFAGCTVADGSIGDPATEGDASTDEASTPAGDAATAGDDALASDDTFVDDAEEKKKDVGTTDSGSSSGDTATPPPADSGTTKPPADSGATDTGSTTPDSGSLTPPFGSLFSAPEPWTKDVSGSPKSSSSDTIISALSSAGGWGTGAFQIDFSITVLRTTASTPFQTFTTTGDFFSPDCDHVPFPVPSGGAIEDESGYACTKDGDCHLLVIDTPSNKLYEMWRANISGGTFYGGCAAVWDLTKAYGDTLRGKGCTSADAGGFPITAMLASPDEVATGSINHALRFILPNARIRKMMYVAPGTHSTGSTSGGASLPPYGVRFRLRADYPVSTLKGTGAQVIARALQKYGMFLSDGGKVPLTVESDRFTTHKWSEFGLASDTLGALSVSDFQVVEMGTPVDYAADDSCYRNP